jgi:2',3'-cyclic-nucleotide 2'-phosphodiesterase (5'-nucleotidase family)
MKSAAFLLLAVAALGFAQTVDAGRAQAAQTAAMGQGAADVIASAAGADAAFFPVGLLKSPPLESIAASLAFPADDVVVVKLTGAQVKMALEKAVTLMPARNPAFLHVSGIEVTADLSRSPDERIASVSIAGAALDPAKAYRIAMPGNLARGGLGYFTIWGADAIERAQTPIRLSEAAASAVAADGLRWTLRP